MAKHLSHRGTPIDMDMLKYQNQYKAALGNGQMNARGDKIGQGGTVIKTREQLLAERERDILKPDIIPEHQSHSVAPSTGTVEDDGFDDSMFDSYAESNSEIEQPIKPKAPVKRAGTKKTS